MGSELVKMKRMLLEKLWMYLAVVHGLVHIVFGIIISIILVVELKETYKF
jgi:vacuolar-type H+-ATPase subunit I/STV1